MAARMRRCEGDRTVNKGTGGGFRVKALAIGSEVARADTVVLGSAQILALFATPVTVIPAPLAGTIIVVDSITFNMLPTATQYTAGGVVTFQYSGGAVVHTGSIAAAVVLSASASYTSLSGLGGTMLAATAVTVSNATGAFATGPGTAKIFLK